MPLAKETIDEIKRILQRKLKKGGCVSRDDVYVDLEQSKYPSKLERYKFKRILSDLIKTNGLPGYAIKTGRNGGVHSTKEVLVKIDDNVVGKINKDKLDKFLNQIRTESEKSHERNSD